MKGTFYNSFETFYHFQFLYHFFDESNSWKCPKNILTHFYNCRKNKVHDAKISDVEYGAGGIYHANRNKSEFARLRTAWGGVIYCNNFDIFSFKTVLLPVSRNLQCQAFWPVIFMWYFGPKLRPIFKRKGLEEVFGKIRKILVGLIEDF